MFIFINIHFHCIVVLYHILRLESSSVFKWLDVIVLVVLISVSDDGDGDSFQNTGNMEIE